MSRASVKINSLLIPLAVVAGLIAGLALSQAGREKDANASPAVAPQSEAPAMPPAEKSPAVAHPASAKAPDAEKSILRLKDYIKNTEEKSTFLKEKVELLSDLLNAKGKELSVLNADNAILKENLNKTIEQHNQLKADLEAKINDLNAQLGRRDADIAALAAAKSGLESQLAELNNKFSGLSTDYAALQAKFDSLGADKSSLEDRLNRLKQELDRQEAANDALNKNVSGLTANLGAKEKERADIAAELEQLKAAKAGAEAGLAQVNAAKAEADNNINQLNGRINELNGLYEEAKKSLFQMTNMINTKEQLIVEKANEIAALKDNLAKSDGAKTMLLASLDEKGKSIADLNLALSSMEARVAALQKDVTAEKERQADTARQLAEATSLNKNLKAKLKNIYIELEMIRAERTGK